jgi:hypothetical protein
MHARRFALRYFGRVCLAGALAVAAFALHASVGTPSAKAIPPCYPDCYPEPVTLSVWKDGSGSGTVTGTGINCGSDCFEAYSPSLLSVVLTATPSANSVVAGWSGC